MTGQWDEGTLKRALPQLIPRQQQKLIIQAVAAATRVAVVKIARIVSLPATAIVRRATARMRKKRKRKVRIVNIFILLYYFKINKCYKVVVAWESYKIDQLIFFFHLDGFMAEEEVSSLIALCLAGLEQVVLRFPEHFKSIYRLAHFYFNNKSTKDLKKCEDLLLGTYSCQYYPGQTFPGLFSDKKATNFFNVSLN